MKVLEPPMQFVKDGEKTDLPLVETELKWLNKADFPHVSKGDEMLGVCSYSVPRVRGGQKNRLDSSRQNK